MKKYSKVFTFLLIASLLVVMLTGCIPGMGGGNVEFTPLPTRDPEAPLPSPMNPDVDWGLVEEAGFSIQNHPDWYLWIRSARGEDRDRGMDVLISVNNFENEQATLETQGLPAISVQRIELSPDEANAFELRRYTEQNIENLRDRFENFTLLIYEGQPEFEEITINTASGDGVIGYVFEYAGGLIGLTHDEINVRQIITFHGTSIFILSYTASYVNFRDADYNNVVDKMIESFTIL